MPSRRSARRTASRPSSADGRTAWDVCVTLMERGVLVECGATAAVFANPQHAYTRRLLATRPQQMYLTHFGAVADVPRLAALLLDQVDAMVALAEGLLEYETLTGDEIKALIRGEKPARDLGDDTPPHRGSAVPKAGHKKGGEAEGGGVFRLA